MGLTRDQQVAKAVKEIRRLHRLGQKSLRRKEGPLTGEQLQALADEVGVNADTLAKARRFADPDSGYTPAELDALCEAISAQAKNDPAAPIFGRTHIGRLVLMPKGGKRAAVQARAIEQSWGLKRLEAELAKQFGRRRFGGRRRRVPLGHQALNSLLEKECDRWLRFQKALDRPAKGNHRSWDDLSEAVALELRALHQRMYRLWIQVLGELKREVPAMGYEPQGADGGEPDKPAPRGRRGASRTGR